MPATPEEMERLVGEFERAHPSVARALADLLVRGNTILAEHGLLQGPLGDAFKAFVLHSINEQGLTKKEFADTLSALNRLRVTVEELDRLHD
jgi:hypothetical protein